MIVRLLTSRIVMMVIVAVLIAHVTGIVPIEVLIADITGWFADLIDRFISWLADAVNPVS